MQTAEYTAITGMSIVLETKIIPTGYLLIKNEKIIMVGPISEQIDFPAHTNVIQCDPSFTLIPGLIDLHIHGGYGADVMDSTSGALQTMAKELVREGTTSFLATTITQSQEKLEKALSNIATYMKGQNESKGAEVLGVHLEGPFISEKRAGAQPVAHIQKPNVDLFTKWDDLVQGLIKVVTLAPEQDSDFQLIKALNKQRKIVSIGHSDATQAEVAEAIQAGARHVTHLYNGMRGFHHREAGVVGAALLYDELFTELIVDGVHSSKESVQLAFRLKGRDKLILITDSMRAKGLAAGSYDLGGQSVYVKGNQALLEDGTLAGSMLKMNEALENMHAFTGASLLDVVYMASTSPAKRLQIDDRKGSIALNKDADLVLINEHFQVQKTWCKGKIVFSKDQ